MTHPRPTDAAVAALPLRHGRAELLEEIMSSTLDEQTDAATPSRETHRPRRWVVPLVAAAAVAALVGVPVALGAGGGDDGAPTAGAGSEPTDATSPEPSQAPAAGTGRTRVALEAPGWTVDVVDGEGPDSVTYAKGPARLDVTGYPAASWAEYVEDREHISDPPAPGRPVDVLGRPGQLWSYAADDHTVIREPQDGRWLEIRASGVDLQEYLDLLGELRRVSTAEFEATLPERFVTSAERDDDTATTLDGIRAALAPAPLVPAGTPEPTTAANDPYYVGVDLGGGVACAWLSEYRDARRAGDAGRVAAAVAALGTARDWPVLRAMDEEGDYPEVVWDYADAAAAGRPVSGFEGGLGCR